MLRGGSWCAGEPRGAPPAPSLVVPARKTPILAKSLARSVWTLVRAQRRPLEPAAAATPARHWAMLPQMPSLWAGKTRRWGLAA